MPTPPYDKSSTPVQPHPVAALLTDEMKARVSAATFIRDGAGVNTGGSFSTCQCPLAVAFAWAGPKWPDPDEAAAVLGTDDVQMIRDLIEDFDEGNLDPADVYALLGCEPPASPEQASERQAGGAGR